MGRYSQHFAVYRKLGQTISRVIDSVLQRLNELSNIFPRIVFHLYFFPSCRFVTNRLLPTPRRYIPVLKTIGRRKLRKTVEHFYCSIFFVIKNYIIHVEDEKKFLYISIYFLIAGPNVLRISLSSCHQILILSTQMRYL